MEAGAVFIYTAVNKYVKLLSMQVITL